ncbi:HIT family protein [Corynebacterium guangdongense]|uniref:ATP adenylyltransferase n=1 Tax=Corynebacterium guangdongense TaxID=1783348 RepID=A0ABU1ZYY7_9CORY|nr:HIT domain-containing protein [Corynebacterium guangdongense]MDR7329472.1 ATP adenylyltransferase [Corynebacterium guangdongense]WJZ18037.1 AP-4-A phosphorylase [Corynebacterium guangdongense]
MPHDANERPERFVDSGVVGNDAADRLDILWAPYRQEYFTVAPESTNGEEEPAEEAVADPFVDAPKHPDEDNHIIARGELVYVILNLYPYNTGHLMVIPYRKVAHLEDLTTAEANELMAFTQRAVRVIKRVSRPDACNIGMNLGRAAGGSIGDHLHMHVVPRWVGDTSFMPIIAGTKVMPATLKRTWQLLHDEWAKLDEEDADGTAS